MEIEKTTRRKAESGHHRDSLHDDRCEYWKVFARCSLLYEQKKAPEIIDISNQSSEEGIRIVIELKRKIRTWKILRIYCIKKDTS